MEDFAKLVCGGWSWEENKQFELALAVVDELDPNRWEAVAAAMVGGKWSPEELQKQYFILVEDLRFIESGFMDEKLELEDDDDHQPWLQLDCDQSLCWTDDDQIQNLLVRLAISCSEELA